MQAVVARTWIKAGRLETQLVTKSGRLRSAWPGSDNQFEDGATSNKKDLTLFPSLNAEFAEDL